MKRLSVQNQKVREKMRLPFCIDCIILRLRIVYLIYLFRNDSFLLTTFSFFIVLFML